MRTRARPSIEEIAKLSGCSKATVDRVLHGRAGVHPRTRDKVNQALSQLDDEYELRTVSPSDTSSVSGTSRRIGFIIQSGQAFTESFLATIEKQSSSERTVELKGLGAASDEAVIEALRGWALGFDGVAIVCKNVPPIIDELKRLRQTGVRVLAVVSDIDYLLVRPIWALTTERPATSLPT